jgi:hypothetical protein
LPATSVLNFGCNDITEFAFGVRSDALPTGAQVKAEGNNILGNSQYGIFNIAGGAIIDARNNWWGQASGPAHSSNPGGTGDAVSDYVLFDPWLKWSACGPPPVGGEWLPTSKLQLFVPLALSATVMAVLTTSFVYVKRKKKQ